MIWNLPGGRAMAWILAVSAIATGLGYWTGGTNAAVKYGAIVLVSLVTAGWLWVTMENYTQQSGP